MFCLDTADCAVSVQAPQLFLALGVSASHLQKYTPRTAWSTCADTGAALIATC